MIRIFAVLVMSGLLLMPCASCFADGEPGQTDRPYVQQEQPAADTVNAASDASFDKRLPPVLPGERVNDSGRTTRVWSTAGPVPVSEEPEPWNNRRRETVNGTENGVGAVGVIVDRRRDHGHSHAKENKDNNH